MAQNIEIRINQNNTYNTLYPVTTGSNVSYSNSSTSSLITHTNVQGAIDDLFTSVSNGKSLIASAITDKGVSTSSNASFSTMSENIGKISSNGLNLKNEQIYSTDMTITSNTFIIKQYQLLGPEKIDDIIMISLNATIPDTYWSSLNSSIINIIAGITLINPKYLSKKNFQEVIVSRENEKTTYVYPFSSNYNNTNFYELDLNLRIRISSVNSYTVLYTTYVGNIIYI